MRGHDGRVVMVTGAGRGMGRAIAARLTDEGARVAVTDVVAASAEETAAALGTWPSPSMRPTGRTWRPPSHGSRPSSVPSTCSSTNAGWDKVGPFLDSDEEFWDRIIDINLKGPLRCVRAVVPSMVERRGGRVVSISSDAGRVGSTGEAVYSATKAGIIGFTKTLAREVARHNVTANVICPGPTETPLLEEIVGEGGERLIESMRRGIPLGRLGRPEDIAGAVAFLASDDAGYITGQTLSVSGGLTMV